MFFRSGKMVKTDHVRSLEELNRPFAFMRFDESPGEAVFERHGKVPQRMMHRLTRWRVSNTLRDCEGCGSYCILHRIIYP
jgi:hypothetical protein